MANTSSGNCIYVDATGDVATETTYLVGLLLTPTAASAVLVLKDKTNAGNTKMDFRAATSGESKTWDLSRTPIRFAEGINIGTLTNAVATLITSTNGKVS